MGAWRMREAVGIRSRSSENPCHTANDVEAPGFGGTSIDPYTIHGDRLIERQALTPRLPEPPGPSGSGVVSPWVGSAGTGPGGPYLDTQGGWVVASAREASATGWRGAEPIASSQVARLPCGRYRKRLEAAGA